MLKHLEKRIYFLCLLTITVGTQAADLPLPTLDPTGNIKAEVGALNGKNVLRYTWGDSTGKPRSASLICQDSAGTNCGGYAWQFTYQAADSTDIAVNAATEEDSGFGYFVSHEMYRQFSDGSNGSIASRHGQDDSPLSKDFAGLGTVVSTDKLKSVHQYTLNYPHWGTIAPLANDGIVSIDPAAHKKYNIPVTITWEFINGKDYPLWRVEYDFSAIPVNTVYADIRGPYGHMRFDNSTDNPVTGVEWGDKYLFAAQPGPAGGLTTESPWQWDKLNTGARFNLLIAGQYEMGIVENKPYAQSTLGSGWSDDRGRNSTQGKGCAPNNMPCDWEWSYQSIQYGLTDNPTGYKKLAWGTAPFVGSDLTVAWINNTENEAFSGYPKVSFGVWITFDKSGGAKTRSLAAAIGGVAFNQAPLAAFSASTLSGNAPLIVTLNASAAQDPDGTINSYVWSSSDGQQTTGKISTLTFNRAGSFSITLTVTDDKGLTASVTQNITVSAQFDAIYDEQNGLLIVQDVRAFGQHYYVELQNLGNYLFKLVNSHFLTNTASKNPAVYDDVLRVLNIPKVFVGGQLYSVELTHHGDFVFTVQNYGKVVE